MNPSHPALRIAIAQLQMQWSGDANTQAILGTIELAAASQARICVFPELAVTGFHRQIVAEATPERVLPRMQAIQHACARHAIAAAVGSPSFGDDGCIYNSQVLVNERGECAAVVEKRGLTAPEATFFARGSLRPVAALQGRRCTAVICREIEDLEDVCAQLGTASPDLIFWPGLMGPDPEAAQADPPVHVQQAQALARRLKAFVIQANWPNSLNYPEQSARTGKSVVIDPGGAITLMLPEAQAGIAMFTLGASEYEWHAKPG